MTRQSKKSAKYNKNNKHCCNCYLLLKKMWSQDALFLLLRLETDWKT